MFLLLCVVIAFVTLYFVLLPKVKFNIFLYVTKDFSDFKIVSGSSTRGF